MKLFFLPILFIYGCASKPVASPKVVTDAATQVECKEFDSHGACIEHAGTDLRANCAAVDSKGRCIGGTELVDREAIRSVFKSHEPEARACYERALKTFKGLEGKIVLKFEFVDGGRVQNAVVAENSMQTAQTADCLVSALRKWKFPEPPPKQTVDVSYPYFFSDSKTFKVKDVSAAPVRPPSAPSK